MFRNLRKQIREAAFGVLPLTVLIAAVNFIVTPMSAMNLLSFAVGAVLLVIGLTLYNLGSGASVEFMGDLIGAEVSKSKKLPLILAVCGAIGVIVTVAEPDLSVLANQVQGIDNAVLILAVASGVGVFMLIAVLRLVFKIELKWVLLAFYGVIFILVFILPREFVPLAFDSSGVTTGPVTVPFIMALGAALSVSLGGKDSQDASFGIVGICSIGPVFAVMFLCLSGSVKVAQEADAALAYSSFGEVILFYAKSFPFYLKEMAISLSPILAFFLIYDFAAFKLSFKRLMRTLVGALYVFLGLALFLMGANVGFVPTGRHIGAALAERSTDMLILMGVTMGALIVLAEPAVHVLTKQVEEVTGGVIKKSVITVALCVSMAVSVGVAMLRIVYDIDLRWVLVAGYGIALALTFIVPKIFTGIAFDSGGVASGAMTASLLLPMASGATYALYGGSPDIGTYVMTDAFGAVALVAMTPLVAIQALGLIFRLKSVKIKKARTETVAALLAREGEVVELAGFSSVADAVYGNVAAEKVRKFSLTRIISKKENGENGGS
ncbi:MAG: DUF1538 domain-containing protein [Clostridia bacterium]|nr:DUF1538 domain-containing protein [Clostridia bacterium]